jgi:hypothetical protein
VAKKHQKTDPERHEKGQVEGDRSSCNIYYFAFSSYSSRCAPL